MESVIFFPIIFVIFLFMGLPVGRQRRERIIGMIQKKRFLLYFWRFLPLDVSWKVM